MLNDREIKELIACQKSIERSEPKHGMQTDGRFNRRSMELKSADQKHSFTMFIRQSTELIEDFSIGLVYKSLDKEKGSVNLIRFNGSHGEVDWSKDGHYSAFHIHRVSESLLNQGNREPKEIELTHRYSTLESALAEFFKEIKLENWQAYFPELKQMTLLGVAGESHE